MNQKTWTDKTFDIINAFMLAVIAFMMLFPFLYVFAVSFSSYKEYLQSDFILWPKQWVLDAYIYIFQSESFIRSLFFTVYITVLGTAVNLLFTSTLGYALTRPVIGKKSMLFMIMFSMLFPAGMIPTYLIVRETHLIDSIWALILPIAINPFNLIVMRQFFLSIPGELIESAVVDGANDLNIYSRIMLPLSKPALAAFGLFYAVGHWNNYFSGLLYINSPDKWPVQVVLRQLVVVNDQDTLRVTNEMVKHLPPPETVQMAALLIATVPILVVYPFLQKHFAKGVMLGAVKG